MKNYYNVEVSYKDKVIGVTDAVTPSQFMFGEDTTEKIINNRIFNDLCKEIFESVAEQFDKFDIIMVTFIDDDDFFICSIGFLRHRFRKKIFDVVVHDWKGNDLQLKFSERESEGIE